MTLKEFKERYLPFRRSKGVMFITVCLFVISLLSTIYLTYTVNDVAIHVNDTMENSAQTLENIQKEIVIKETLKDILIVLCSITGTDLLLGVMTEINSKNKFLTDFFENQIFASEFFYDSMSDDVKKEIADHILLNRYEGDATYKQICETATDKLINDHPDYYYKKCVFNVYVSDKGDYFEKQVFKEVLICPCRNIKSLDNVSICCTKHKMISDKPAIEIVNVSVNGNGIDPKKLKNIQSENKFGLAHKNGYKEQTKYVLPNKLNFKDTKESSLNVNLITRCPKDDLTSSYRTTVPCKNFTVNFTIDSDKYKLAAYAFGFYDDANKSTNHEQENTISVTFNDWIFNDDGVCVVIIPKTLDK